MAPAIIAPTMAMVKARLRFSILLATSAVTITQSEATAAKTLAKCVSPHQARLMAIPHTMSKTPIIARSNWKLKAAATVVVAPRAARMNEFFKLLISCFYA